MVQSQRATGLHLGDQKLVLLMLADLVERDQLGLGLDVAVVPGRLAVGREDA